MSRAKSDFVDWASCLHPFGEDPYGPALPHDPVCAAIREARREDDPGLPQGVWERKSLPCRISSPAGSSRG